jgi:hypothetical protein
LRRFHRSRWRYLLKHAPLDTLLSETMPAEMAWLGRINRLEKAAVADAYLRTVQRLVDIMAARTGDGNTAFSYEGQVALFAGLRRLRDMAWRVGGMTEAPELERWQVREPAFTSNVPLLGGAISWLRTTWLNMAARWYVRPLLEQQYQFNQMMADQLYDIQQQQSALDGDQAALWQAVGELRQRL